MKTNETKMKKMMVKGVCSVALAGTVFGTVAPMVENNVAYAYLPGNDVLQPWDSSFTPAWDILYDNSWGADHGLMAEQGQRDIVETRSGITGKVWFGNADVTVDYKIPMTGESGVYANIHTGADGSFQITDTKNLPEGSVLYFYVESRPVAGVGYQYKQDHFVPDNGGDVTPEPEKPSVPDNGGDVTPEPEKPSVPDNGGDVTPEPEKPSTPNIGEEVTSKPGKPATPTEKPVANNKSATNQQPTYNTGDTLAKTATTNNSVILAAIGGIASLVMGLETLISRKK